MFCLFNIQYLFSYDPYLFHFYFPEIHCQGASGVKGVSEIHIVYLFIFVGDLIVLVGAQVYGISYVDHKKIGIVDRNIEWIA